MVSNLLARIFLASLLFLNLTAAAPAQNYVWVANTLGHSIVRFDSNGNFVDQIADVHLLAPVAIKQRKESMLVLDVPNPHVANSARLLRYSAFTGAFLGETTLQNEDGSIGGGSEMVVVDHNTVLVANGPDDNAGPAFVDAFDVNTGTRLYRIVQPADQGSRALAISKDRKYLFVGTYGVGDQGLNVYTHRLSDGVLVQTTAPGFRVQGLLVVDDELYVSGQSRGEPFQDYVQRYQMENNGALTFFQELSLPGPAGSARSMTLIPGGFIDLLRNPLGGGRIDRIDIKNGALAVVSNYGDGLLNTPGGIAYAAVTASR